MHMTLMTGYPWVRSACLMVHICFRYAIEVNAAIPTLAEIGILHYIHTYYTLHLQSNHIDNQDRYTRQKDTIGTKEAKRAQDWTKWQISIWVSGLSRIQLNPVPACIMTYANIH